MADATTDALRRRIIAGELKDGEPLRQDLLADELGVSRIPVREALKRLEAEGLVASVPHKGSVVTALTGDEIKELFDLRAVLEPELIRHSIPRMNQAHLDQISRLFAEHEQDFAPNDVHRWGELNTRYHLALYAASDRRKTMEIVRSLLLNTDRYTRLVLVLTPEVLNEGREDHRRLLQCCLRGSVEEGVELVREHAGHCSVSLLEALERKRAQAG